MHRNLNDLLVHTFDKLINLNIDAVCRNSSNTICIIYQLKLFEIFISSPKCITHYILYAKIFEILVLIFKLFQSDLSVAMESIYIMETYEYHKISTVNVFINI